MLPSPVAPIEQDGLERLRLLVRISEEIGSVRSSGLYCSYCPTQALKLAELGRQQRQLFESIAVQLANGR